MSDQSQSSRFFQVLFESALQDYKSQTGITLAGHPLAEQLQDCDSVESVIALLQGQAREFDESRGDDVRIMKSLRCIVSVLHTLSASTALREITGLSRTSTMRQPPEKALFAAIAILLATGKDVSSGYDTLVDLLGSIERFMNRLDVYTRVPPTDVMAETIAKIMVELLSTLALATKQIKQKKPIKFIKNLFGVNGVDAVLQRLDRLTLDEGQTTAAQALEVIYGLVQNLRATTEDDKVSNDSVQCALETIQRIASDMNKTKRDELRKDIQNWLSPPDPWKNHNNACASRHTGTALWFVQGDAFSEWKSSGPSSLLWVHGKPGAGKSILCSSIIQDIDTMTKYGLASLAFFYCDFNEDQKGELRGMVSSLLVQLCHQANSYYDTLSDFYSKHAQGSKRPTEDALVDCLKEILKVSGQAPVYIVLDALDECRVTSSFPSPRDKILEFVEELIDSKIPNLRICVTSRPEIDIKDVLSPLTFRAISLHDEIGQMEDINNYIKSVVSTNRSMRRWNQADKELVIEVLTNKANGMFQWVYCQLHYLHNCRPERVRHVLDKIPETLDGTYERTLRDIDQVNWELAHRLLQCVSVASRPLHVGELAEFLGFDFTLDPIPNFHKSWLPEDPVDAVLSTTSTLLSIVDVDGSPVIQFSHFSVKEFLTSSRLASASDIIIRRHHVSMKLAHTHVAQACLGMLLHLNNAITRDDLRQFPLAEYAAKHWVDHVRFEDVSLNVEDGMKQLFDPRKHRFAVWVWIFDWEDPYWRPEKRSERPSQPRGTPLHYAALCGLQAIVKYLVTIHSQDVRSQSFGHKSTPLHMASRGGHVEVTRVLLDHGAETTASDNEGSTPLHLASRDGHAEVVRVLLECGADAKAKDKQGQTPVRLALLRGHVGITRMFLERGEISMDGISKGLTPLHQASFAGNTELVDFLLKEGADVGAQAEDGTTPLHAASVGGHIEVLRILIKRGANLACHENLGWTPLHSASKGGHVKVARFLLQSGALVRTQDKEGVTPLHLASEEGHVEVVHALFEHGADAKAPTNEGWTPLHSASLNGHVEVARILFKNRADANAKTNNGVTPLHSASLNGHVEVARVLLDNSAATTAPANNGSTPLHFASLNGYVDIARFLLENGAVAAAQTDNGWTPLHSASLNGHVDVTHILFENGADASSQTKNGWTPLHVASLNGHVKVARVLFDKGADARVQDDSGSTPLHAASLKGHVEVARALFENGADVTVNANNGWTPLHWASQEGHVELARVLFENGADVTARAEDGSTPLHRASARGHVEVALFLLEKGADATARANDGWAPLDWASKEGHVELARVLFENGADVMARAEDGSTPLHRASAWGHFEVALFLLEKGAEVTARANDGWAPLHWASEGGHIKLTRVLLEKGASTMARIKHGLTALHMASIKGHIEVVHVLLENHADVMAQAGEGWTPLHWASQEGHAKVVRVLLDKGADATTRTDSGWTALHLASVKGHVDVAHVLLEKGADATARANNGWTPLHSASLNGHEKVASVLFEKGADVRVQTNDGSTPLHLASREGHVKFVRMLLEHGADMTTRTEDKRTPLDVASRNGHVEVACILSEHCADAAAHADDGRTPLVAP